MGEFEDGYEPKKPLNQDRQLEEYLHIAQGHAQLEEFKLSDGGKKLLNSDEKTFMEEYRAYLIGEVQKAVDGAKVIKGRSVADIKKTFEKSMAKRFQGWFEEENESALFSFAESVDQRLANIKAKTEPLVPAPFQPRGMSSLVSQYAEPVREIQPQLDRLAAVQRVLSTRLQRPIQ